MKPFLLPAPEKIVCFEGKSALSRPISMKPPEGISWDSLTAVCPGTYELCMEEGKTSVFFQKDCGYLPQTYALEITKEKILITYGDETGAFYALVTIWQMALEGETLPCCKIEDSPVIKNRGFMMDISREKVPTLATLKQLVNLLARFKYNQLQLYIEGFSFVYPSFPGYSGKNAALTSEELKELSLYCARRFIDLVPNQNSLGHMAPWLAKPEFRRLAECENGLNIGGFTLPPTTLDTNDSGSLKLVETLIEDLLPNFTSSYMHAGLDEPFELGKGKNAGENPDELFLSYARALNGIVKDHGRRMMIWADCVSKSEFLIKNLPEDIILMEWGYEKEHPFEQRCEALQAAGRSFYTCPGTGSWLSFTGMTDNMMANVKNAVLAAVKYHGEGVLLTDWGDMHHLQYLPASYPGVVYCAALAWSGADLAEKELANGLNRFVYQDKEEIMGQFALDAGRYYHKEEFELPCRALAALPLNGDISTAEKYESQLSTLLFIISVLSPKEVSAYYLAEYEKRKPPQPEALFAYLDELLARLNQASPRCADGSLIKGEYQNALEMVRLLSEYRFSVLENKKFEKQAELNETVSRHQSLWLSRNKKSGLQAGVDCLNRLVERR